MLQLMLLCVLCLFTSTMGADVTLSNPPNNGTVSWMDASIWDSGSVPGENDTVIIDGRGFDSPLTVLLDHGPGVSIWRLLVFNATLRVFMSQLTLLNDEGVLSSEFWDGASLILHGNTNVHMPVVCRVDLLPPNTTRDECLATLTPTIVLYDSCSISMVPSLAHLQGIYGLYGGFIVLTGADARLTVDLLAFFTLFQTHVLLTGGARGYIRTIMLYGNGQESKIMMLDSSIHVDYTSYLSLSYAEQNCQKVTFSSTKWVGQHTVVGFNADEDAYPCHFCIDGVLDVQPAPCFDGNGVRGRKAEWNGIIGFVQMTLRLRGHTLFRGGAISLERDSDWSVAVMKASHNDVFLLGAWTYVHIFARARIDLLDNVRILGCASIAVADNYSGPLGGQSRLSSSTFGSTAPTRSALSPHAVTCTPADANDLFSVPVIVPVMNDTMEEGTAEYATGVLRIGSVHADSGLFCVDSLKYRRGRATVEAPIQVGDVTFTRPIWFRVGAGLSSADSAESTLVLDNSKSFMQMGAGPYLNEILVVTNVTLVARGGAIVYLGHINNLHPWAGIYSVNLPRVVTFTGSIEVDGVGSAFFVAGSLNATVYGLFELTQTSSSIVVRNGATFGNGRVDNTTGELITLYSNTDSYTFYRSGDDPDVPALSVLPGSVLLWHSRGVRLTSLQFGRNEAFTYATFRTLLLDCTIYLFDQGKMEFFHYGRGSPVTYVEMVGVDVHMSTTSHMIWWNIDVRLQDVRFVRDDTSVCDLALGKECNIDVVGTVDIGGVKVLPAHSGSLELKTTVRLAPSSVLLSSMQGLFEDIVFLSDESLANETWTHASTPVISLREVPNGVTYLINATFVGPLQLHVMREVHLESSGAWHTKLENALLYAHAGSRLFMSQNDKLVGDARTSLIFLDGAQLVGTSADYTRLESPWYCDNGCTITRMYLFEQFGAMMNGTFDDVNLSGIVDVRGSAHMPPHADVLAGICGRAILQEAPINEPMASLYASYMQWSAPCAGRRCCTRVRDLPNGAELLLNNRVDSIVLDEGVAQDSSNLLLGNALIRYRRPPADGRYWRVRPYSDGSGLTQGFILGDKVETLMEFTQAVGNYVQFIEGAIIESEAIGTGVNSAHQPTFRAFGPYMLDVQHIADVHVHLHANHTVPDLYNVVRLLNASVLEVHADAHWHVPRVHIDVGTELLVHGGVDIALNNDSLVLGEEDESVMRVVDTVLRVDERTFRGERLQVRFERAHVHVAGEINCVDCTFVLGAASTMSVEAKAVWTHENGMFDIVVESGARLVLSSAISVRASVRMQEDSELLLRVREGMSVIDGDLLLDGVDLVLIDDSADNVALMQPLLSATGDAVLTGAIGVRRFLASKGAIEGKNTYGCLPVIGSTSSLSCDLASSSDSSSSLSCEDNIGVSVDLPSDASAPRCMEVPLLASRHSCLQCVSDWSRARSCLYVIQEIFTGIYGAACVAGSAADGPLALAAAEGALVALSGGDCYVKSQPRCHGRRTREECEGFGGRAPFFDKDDSIEESARCVWCPRHAIDLGERCMTESEVSLDFCLLPVNVSVKIEPVSVTTFSLPSSVAATSKRTEAAENIYNGPSEVLLGVIGGLATLLLLIFLSILLLFALSRQRKKRERERGREEEEVSMTSLDGLGAQSSAGKVGSSLPTTATEETEYATIGEFGLPTPEGGYASGDLQPHVGVERVNSYHTISASDLSGSTGSGMGVNRVNSYQTIEVSAQLVDAGYATGALAGPGEVRRSSVLDEYAVGDLGM